MSQDQTHLAIHFSIVCSVKSVRISILLAHLNESNLLVSSKFEKNKKKVKIDPQ